MTSELSFVQIVRLEAQLRRKLRNRVKNFRVELREDGIVLLGKAPSYYDKQIVQADVLEQSDLPIAANEITVVYDDLIAIQSR